MKRTHTRRFAWMGALALAAGTAVVATTPEQAAAHGGLTFPATRTYACYVEAIQAGDGGSLNPQNEMCRQLLATNGNYPFYNWFGNLLSNADGRHREVVPDGRLCGPGSQFSAVNTPGNWPTTNVQPGQQVTFQYNAWAQHPGRWDQYITRDGWDPRQPLRWSDLEPAPFDSVVNPPLRQGGPQGAEYYWNATLPNKQGQHIIYSIWTRSDSPEAFYNCSDVNFGGTTPTPTTPPPTTPPPTTTPPTTPPPTTTPPTTPPPTTTPPTTPPPTTGACTAAVTVVNSWPGGYQGDVRVTAGSSAVNGWSVNVSGASIQQAWGGTLSGSSTISNAAWNGSLGSGASTTAGFIGSGSPGSLSATCTAG